MAGDTVRVVELLERWHGTNPAEPRGIREDVAEVLVVAGFAQPVGWSVDSEHETRLAAIVDYVRSRVPEISREALVPEVLRLSGAGREVVEMAARGEHQ